MGFGGGGSGSFVLPNHEHTNVLADGGALVGATSLVDAETLDAWFATEFASSFALENPAKLKLIETHLPAAAESTYDFDFTGDPFDPDVDACVILDSIIAPSGIFDLKAVISGNTTASWQYNFSRMNAANWSHFSGSGLAYANIGYSSMFFSGYATRVITEFYFLTGETKRIAYKSSLMSGGGQWGIQFGGYNATSITELDQIVLSTSASTWKANSAFSLYRKLR
jgi:hypothetical protein